MHVCRKKIGDGTLLSSVWDLRDGTVNLFFYHNFDTTIQMHLKDELNKGDHSIAIERLFPLSSEFEQLRYFQTTKNNNWIALFILGSAAIFLFSSIFFLVQYFRARKNLKYALLRLILFPIGLVLFYYMYVLSSNLAVFFFPAPYQSPTNAFVSLASYIPLLLLVLILPLLILNYRIYKEQCWSRFAFGLFTINNLIYIGLIGLFQYWKFFDVFN
jgi:cytochrome c oxidase subunit IV